MLLRIVLLGLLLSVLYRVLRDVLRSALRWVAPPKDGSCPTDKKSSWDINKNRIRDAEFRDMDG